MFGKTNHIHFIGIGGIGMSGMAELLHKLGFSISGSDQNRSERTDNLKEIGLTISEGHSQYNINGADVVVYSSAVQHNNPEIIAAEKRARKKRAYIVLSKSRNYMYGAFPHTEDGYKMALDYVEKSKDEELYIKEK